MPPKLHHPDLIKLRNRHHAVRSHKKAWAKIKQLINDGKTKQAHALARNVLKKSPRIKAIQAGSSEARARRAAFLRMQRSKEKGIRVALRDLGDKLGNTVRRAAGKDGKISPGRLNTLLKMLKVSNRDAYKEVNSTFLKMLRMSAKAGVHSSMAIGQKIVAEIKKRKASESDAIECATPGVEPITVYVVRHGTTPFNAEGRLRGWADVPLDADGRKEAQETAAVMVGKRVDRIYSSDLSRALETASAIGKAVGKTPEPQPELRPINFGDWNGELLSEIGPSMDALFKRWKINPKAKAPDGESFQAFQERVLGFLRATLKNAEPGSAIMYVGHLRISKLLHAFALNGSQPLSGDQLEILNHVEPDPGDVSVFKCAPTTLQMAMVHQRNNKSSAATDISSGLLPPIRILLDGVPVKEDGEEDDSVDPTLQTIDYGVRDSVFQKVFDGALKQTMQAGLFGDTGISNRVWDLRDGNFLIIKRIVSNGIANGSSASDIAQQLKDLLGNPDGSAWDAASPGAGIYRSAYKNAMRLARTETNSAYGAANALFASEKEWDVMWHVSDGQREEDECDDLDGEVMTPDEFLDQYPQHPNCLCYSTMVVPDFAPDEGDVTDVSDAGAGDGGDSGE